MIQLGWCVLNATCLRPDVLQSQPALMPAAAELSHNAPKQSAFLRKLILVSAFGPFFAHDIAWFGDNGFAGLIYMRRFKLMVAVMVCMSLLSASSSAIAADSTLREVFEDAFYGAGIGALVGGAILAFTKKPADHLDYIGYGAATGVLAGTAYGLAKSARALAEIDNGRVRIAVPTIMPNLVESSAGRQSTVMWSASLLRGTFN